MAVHTGELGFPDFVELSDAYCAKVFAPVSSVEIRLGAPSVGFWVDVSFTNVTFNDNLMRLYGPTGTSASVITTSTSYSVERARLFRTEAGWLIREDIVMPTGVVSAFTAMDSPQLDSVRGSLGLGSAAYAGAAEFIPADKESTFSPARLLNEFYVYDGMDGFIAVHNCGDLYYESVNSNVEIAQLGSLCTLIEGNAGFNNSNLRRISFPNSPISIANSAFYQCVHLLEVDKLANGSWIDEGAFWGCSSLMNIDFLPDDLTAIPPYCFKEAGSGALVIPDRVVSIGENAFEASLWTTIIIPGSVTTINAAFAGAAVQNLVINEGTTAISTNAFYGCSNLYNVYLPSTIASIGSGAFSVIYAGVVVICRAMTAPVVAADSFDWGHANFSVPIGATGYDVAPWIDATVTYDL